MTGYSIGEYVRNRRLYQAAIDLRNTDEKIIDIALKYGYETPQSFTKAFTRFHAATPSQVRKGGSHQTFLPLTIKIQICGGNNMDYKIVKMFPFKVIGFVKKFTYDNSFQEIPKFWDEIFTKYTSNIFAGSPPVSAYGKAFVDNCIGEYGVCIDDNNTGEILYLIAGKYTGGEVPEGMMLYEFPALDWAIFDCIGPATKAIQETTQRVFNEWLPQNPDYELDINANIEWYSSGNTDDEDYRSAIWIPVKKK